MDEDKELEAAKKEIKSFFTPKRILLASVLGAIYLTTGGNPSGKSNYEKYPLPSEIKVIETNLPYEERRVPQYLDSKGIVHNSEKIVRTSNIDFSKNFNLKTDRYNLVKADDWLPLRIWGHLASLPVKFYFFDWNVNWGVDSERTRAALSMLEKNKDLDGLTVRLNHTKAFEDMERMFKDEKITDRNPLIYRATYGALTCLMHDLFACLSRGDYYNSATQTLVNYSNIESVFAHELGHNKDFKSYPNDWVYSMARAIPPVMLYQEWQASTIARDKVTSPDDKNQFFRYNIPGFITYAMAVGSLLIGNLKAMKKGMKESFKRAQEMGEKMRKIIEERQKREELQRRMFR